MFRESYTAEEWRTLQFAPLWVFAAVASADGNIDEKKVGGLAKELSEWAQFKEPLVQEVLLSLGTDLASIMARYTADSRNVMVGLKDVADLLDKKSTPEQAKNFKGAMLLIGRNIAQASGDGLGGGFDTISQEGKTALALIVIALRAM
jgi:hypothetical protein